MVMGSYVMCLINEDYMIKLLFNNQKAEASTKKLDITEIIGFRVSWVRLKYLVYRLY